MRKEVGWRSLKPARRAQVHGENEEGGMEVVGADEAGDATTTSRRIHVGLDKLLDVAGGEECRTVGAGTRPGTFRAWFRRWSY
jgi:hypothetical protein